MKAFQEFSVQSEGELVEGVVKALLGLLKPGDWISLEGDLGAGKTTLVRKFLFALGYRDPVVSPTYPLLIEYDLSNLKIIHIDGFRLDGKNRDPWDYHEWKNAMVFVEWPEKTQLPKNKFKYLIRIEAFENEKREITFFSV